MVNKKKFRITIGIVLLLILIVAIVPNFYLYHSIDGVINAKTTTLTSPIEGILHFSQPVRVGTFFKKGEIIGNVVNARVNKSFLHELITEKKTLEGRIKSLSERIQLFTDLNKSLSKNVDNYQKFSANQLRLMLKQAEHKRTQELAELERAKKELEGSQYLSKKSAVSKRELERHESNYEQSKERLSQIQNQIEELKNSLKAVEAGSFLGTGHNDSPYSKQRMDQLVIEIAQAKTALTEAKQRVEGIDQQIAKENARIDQAEKFVITAPFDSLVWRMPLTEGSTVVINSELITLLDCSSIFLDISASESSQFAEIKAGDTITYRLIGDTQFHKGKIFALRGSGSVLEDRHLAAHLEKDSSKECQIWIQPDPKDLKLSPANFYQVGRRIEARIPRKWNITKMILRFCNVF